MGKRRAREIWEYDSMAEFTADGGAAAYKQGNVLIAGALYWSDGVTITAGGGAGGFSVQPGARKTIALLGDSYTDRDKQYYSGGWQSIIPKSIFEWINIRLGKRLDPVYWDAIPGTTVAPNGGNPSFLDRIDAFLLASVSDYVWVQGTVNNFGTSPVALADQITAYTTIIQKIIKDGRIPIITTVPCSSNVNSMQDYADWTTFNNWLRTTGRELGAIVCDYANGLLLASSRTGQPDITYKDVGDTAGTLVHRNSAGAMIDSYYGYESLKNYIPEWIIPWIEVYDSTATGQMISCVKNPIMVNTGTAGTADAGASGVIATDCRAGISGTVGTSTIACSLKPRTDGAAGNWQEMTVTFGGDATTKAYFQQTTLNLGNKSIGDEIECIAEFELEETNISAIKQFYFRIQFTGATGERSYEFVEDANSVAALEGGMFKGILSTPRRTIPAGATSINISLEFVRKTDALPVTARIGRVNII